MAWTDEMALMEQDCAAQLGRAVTIYANPVGSEGLGTGVDGTSFDQTATITAICHEAIAAFRPVGGGASVREEERRFDFVLADLSAVCAASDGLPVVGRFAIEDPSDSPTEFWWATRIEQTGDRKGVRVTAVRGQGPKSGGYA